jgi:hypothetical protein
MNHDTAEALADAGFVVAAINHPGDNGKDLSRRDDLSVFGSPVARVADSLPGKPEVHVIPAGHLHS